MSSVVFGQFLSVLPLLGGELRFLSVRAWGKPSRAFRMQWLPRVFFIPLDVPLAILYPQASLLPPPLSPSLSLSYFPLGSILYSP